MSEQKHVEKKVIKLNSLADVNGIDEDDWEDVANMDAVIELPDGSKWLRDSNCHSDHHEAVAEAEFRRRNKGTSMKEAGEAQLQAYRELRPEPWFDWHGVTEYHDVFERIDGPGSYCVYCGTAWELPGVGRLESIE
ncbi:MAG: hypothetical protein WD688_18565 [Candidatus Binatia bacterium]